MNPSQTTRPSFFPRASVVKKKEMEKIRLDKVRLIINSSKKHLACSPDNFVDDGSAEDI